MGGSWSGPLLPGLPPRCPEQELSPRIQLSRRRCACGWAAHWHVANAQQSSYFESLGASAHKADPSNGFVNYLGHADAINQGLAKYVGNQVYLGVDSQNQISESSIGRSSIRLESKHAFNNGLLVADIAHMPGNACGIWPALYVSAALSMPILLEKLTAPLVPLQMDFQLQRNAVWRDRCHRRLDAPGSEPRLSAYVRRVLHQARLGQRQ